MTIPLTKSIQKWNPCCDPDWRRRRASELARRQPSPGRTTQYDDSWVKAYKPFLVQYEKFDAQERARLMSANPALYFAHYIFDRGMTGTRADADVVLLIEARLIAGQSDEEIAATLGTHPEVIQWYAKLFFDVRDRLDNRDWIVSRVLVPALMRSPISEEAQGRQLVDDDGDAVTHHVSVFGQSFLDGSCKYFAYYGGPAVLDTLLGGDRRNATAETATIFLDDFFKRQVRIKAIQAITRMPINRYNVGLLQENYLRIIELEKSAGDNADESTYRASMRSLLDNLRFSAGDEARDTVAKLPYAKYYNQDYELRDQEMHTVLGGGTLQLEDQLNPLVHRESAFEKGAIVNDTTNND